MKVIMNMQSIRKKKKNIIICMKILKWIKIDDFKINKKNLIEKTLLTVPALRKTFIDFVKLTKKSNEIDIKGGSFVKSNFYRHLLNFQYNFHFSNY